jgi:hypothetical protein
MDEEKIISKGIATVPVGFLSDIYEKERKLAGLINMVRKGNEYLEGKKDSDIDYNHFVKFLIQAQTEARAGYVPPIIPKSYYDGK